jgi:hypothetical protein
MDFIITIIFIFAISIVALSFVNLKLSLAFYVSYLILVPYLEFKIGSLSLSYNLVNSLLFLIFLYQFKAKRKVKLNYKLVKPFLFLFASLFLLSLFEDDTPWDIQFNYLRLSFMMTTIISFVIWNMALTDVKILNYIKWSLIISFTISGVYGVYLMSLGGLNPYTSYLALYFGAKLDVADVYSSAESRLSFSTAGKIQSTMVHPMTWGMYLCFVIGVMIFYFFKEKKIWYLPLVCLLGFNLLISGVRTGLLALMISGAYYLVRSRQFRLIIYALIMIFVSFLVINMNKDLTNIFSSITDISGTKSDVRGSTLSMRLDQLSGAVREIKGREMVGKGYGWTAYYQASHGDHPILRAFESLVFVVLCNGGIIGTFIWIIFFFSLFRLQRKMLRVRESIILMDALVITYLSYAIGTGEYGYLQIFALFYAFLMASLINFNEINLKTKSIIYEEESQSNSLLLTAVSPYTGK